jgi:hypothetical protein
VSERFPPEAPDEITRRQWLLRLGEMIVLAGVSGVVPESIAGQLDAGSEEVGALPPGLYAPSAEHLVHALQSAGKLYATPPGSETDYVQPSSLPFQPQFFSHEEFRVVTRFAQIVLGNLDANALSQTTQWLDLWLYSAAGVLEAAKHLDSLHRVLAVAYYGEASVVDLENSDLQVVARAGLEALHEVSVEKHGRGFLELSDPQQVDLIVFTSAAKPDSPLGRFFEAMRREVIRGYYTSAEGLKELDYKGNSYYPDSPGCTANQGHNKSQKFDCFPG